MAAYEYLLRFAEPAAPSTWYVIGGTHGRTSSSSDTPANTFVPGNFARLPTFALSLFDGIEPSPNPRGGLGAVVLLDTTGTLDPYAAKVWDGGNLELRRGAVGADLSTFATVGSFTTAGILFDHNTKQIRVRDLGAFLAAAPLHDDRYGGTGGADGDAALKGVWKPYGVGRLFNVTPKLINATKLIYQLSCTPIEQVETVYDGGADITFAGPDLASYAALDAATVSAGTYKTCLAEGLFRLGSKPTLALTVHFKGDKTGGSYVSQRGAIASRVVTRAGTALTAGQVDSLSTAAVDAAQINTCGFYWDQPISKAQALTEILQGCLGYWFVSLAGVLKVGILAAPSGSPDVTYRFPDQCGTPEQLEAYQVPRWKTIIGFQRNYTLLDDAHLAGTVADVNRPIFAAEAQWETAETVGQKSTWPGAAAVQMLGGYADSSGAAAEAPRQQAIFATQRQRWRVALNEDPFVLAGYLGKKVAIANYPRYGWPNPRTFILVGVEWGAAPWPTATLWG
ncbi:MAG: hypothetical protein U1E60_06255 [Reyranellaceae bacterium]